MFLLKRFAPNSNKNFKVPLKFSGKPTQVWHCLIKLPKAKYSVCLNAKQRSNFPLHTSTKSSSSSSNNLQCCKVDPAFVKLILYSGPKSNFEIYPGRKMN